MASTRFQPDRELSTRMVVVMFLLGLLYTAAIADLIASASMPRSSWSSPAVRWPRSGTSPTRLRSLRCGRAWSRRRKHGSVLGKTYNPWYLKSSDVECFSARDGQYHRLLGADAHVYRLQVEGFADTILHGAPMQGATVDDGLAALRALVAIARSTESGERIRLADVSGEP